MAFQLFFERGFDETTVDEIAVVAGIGRRTFFRYFPSKNDLPWGDFEELLDGMRAFLAGLPATMPLMAAIRNAVLEFNRIPEVEVQYHRRRMQLLLHVPTLLAHSTLRYAAWREVVAEFAAARLGVAVDRLEPQTIAWTSLAACLAAYEEWLRHDDAELLPLLGEAFDTLEHLFDRSDATPDATDPDPA